MARTRRARPELTESWDDVDDNYEDEEPIFDEDEERLEIGDDYEPEGKAYTRDYGNNAARRRSGRTLRSSAEPELVMPASPDALPSRRMSTPRSRMNERSTTSDAGHMRKVTRTRTPHFRLVERSQTSDAGKFRSMRRVNEDEDVEDGSSKVMTFMWERIIHPILDYAVDILGLALRNAKPIIGWIVLFYILLAAFVFGSGFLTNSIHHALSPICRLPFTSHFAFCPSRDSRELNGPAEFDKLVQAQDAFQDILASTSVGVNLPLDMKRSEASIRDLKHVVQYSRLPSRNELVFEFGGFIDTARQASNDLSRFNSRIGRAVDHILSTNRWTLSVIDGVSATEASHGAISKWVSRNLNIFSPFQPVSLSQDVLLDQYLRHTGAVEEQILNLISEAHALRDILDNLDGRLDVIAGIATRDGIKTEANKDELFATLWTKLGGNRASVAKLNQQLELLHNVGTYRRVAWGHVTTTLLKLQEIQHSLEDLRERVAMPETVGIDRVPLEVHIKSINLGIERLEQQRDASRQLEAQNYAKVISKAEADDKRMIGDNEL